MDRLAFITGSRSEFGALSGVMKALQSYNQIYFKILVHGAHNNRLFGKTSNEIIENFRDKVILVDTLEGIDNKKDEFLNTISKIHLVLEQNKFTHVYLVGDRIECYAAALAAHLLKLTIFHYGGGNISAGSDDNIYRYNITNLANIHLATSKPAFQRIHQLPVINKEHVHFAGSSAVDSIYNYLLNPEDLDKYFPLLKRDKYVLITFHPATNSDEKIAGIADFIINLLVRLNFQVLATYPNHDSGYQDIIDVIEKWRTHENVFVEKHLGQIKYYTAVNNSAFVIGNTSSGFVEVPYFSKVFYNVGNRQNGRDADDFVVSLPAHEESIKKELTSLTAIERIKGKKNSNLYGDGHSIEKIIQIINNSIQTYAK
jgi:UDP-hydrolysing UDP-N-acetyl-D-glucosamine 2-epimerase